MQKQRDDFLSSLCWQGVEEGVYPGAAAAVAFRSKSTWKKVVASCGYTRTDGKGTRVDNTTFFDLASLTKPLCTVLCYLHMAGTKQVDLTTSVMDIPCCQDFPSWWRQIRLVDLLSHSSGLPAYREYYKDFFPTQNRASKHKLLSLIKKEGLEYPTGSKCLYSDLGYILLGFILEELSGLSLDAFFRTVISAPLHLDKDLVFMPVATVHLDTEIIAATEYCPWRQRLLVGEVHDEHAWLMGGVAGHAGLFGKVEALGALCMLLVDIWHQRAEHPKLDGNIVRAALAYTTDAGVWALGFDRPSLGYSSSGNYFSATSVGHLGYAGTSFWLDLEQEKVVILLSNRVHPSRENKKIQQFRPYFHNRIMQELL
ncbi:MAG: beta-lactamase family protein [Desulfobulbaceae bacterium]|nr:beta-lactamase family protein [Desulfobulbaceae bacterium]